MQNTLTLSKYKNTTSKNCVLDNYLKGTRYDVNTYFCSSEKGCNFS